MRGLDISARLAVIRSALNQFKVRLGKESQSILRPDLFEKWSHDKHGVRLSALDLLQRRPPLFIFAGDVGMGKTELNSTDNPILRPDAGCTHGVWDSYGIGRVVSLARPTPLGQPE